jgi:DNA-binding beta-propeller fold protein YncE
VPSGVVLVDDGAYALVSVAGKKDVYVLDLVTESIDLLELDAVPSAMVDDPVAGATVFVYANSARADIVDHLFFELQSVTLDEPATDAVQTELGTLLYNTHGTYHDVITLDAATGDWHEQRAENPVMQLELVGESYAVATMSPDSYSNTGGTGGFYDEHYGFGIFPLAPVTGENPRDPVSVVLESQPVGLATTSDGVQHFALLLLDGVDSLLKVNVTDASAQQIDLEAAPLGILPSPDGRFVVTGDSAIGMVSFVNPDSDTPTTVAGFATLGLAERHRLPRRESQE